MIKGLNVGALIPLYPLYFFPAMEEFTCTTIIVNLSLTPFLPFKKTLGFVDTFWLDTSSSITIQPWHQSFFLFSHTKLSNLVWNSKPSCFNYMPKLGKKEKTKKKNIKPDFFLKKRTWKKAPIHGVSEREREREREPKQRDNKSDITHHEETNRKREETP